MCYTRQWGDTLNFTWHKPALNYIIQLHLSVFFYLELPLWILKYWCSPYLHTWSLSLCQQQTGGRFNVFSSFFSSLDWKWGLRKLTCPPLSGTYEKLVLETSSIKHRQDNMPMIQKTTETVDIVWKGKKPRFLSSQLVTGTMYSTSMS